eukprot:TRINITY_DN1927_c0_g3_i1.p2 TRINITY_DN1927_c0_g3~~TRINITY_DN1927_c0_g3_i1.p2  ORF type:complete len:237 (+),score=49.81 TRINITY_DN1927_c0_g3_i1:104-712(+)
MAMEMVGPWRQVAGLKAARALAIVRAAAEERCWVLRDLLLDAEAQWKALDDASETHLAIKIFAEMPSGETRSFDVKTWDKVDSVKAKICKLDLDSHRLVVTSELESGRLLRDYNVVDYSTLRLVPTMPIYVRIMTGPAFKIDVTMEDTVQSLKVRICARCGVSESGQRVLYSGRMLEDGKQLRDYGIRSKAVLNVVLRLVGS